jgi:hypothetical protein
MSYRAKRELLVQVAPRYRAARHGERSAILDEFIAVTGYDRKYAIRVLLGPIGPPAPIRRPRAAHYDREVQEALATVWLAANEICAKRLVPFLVELVPTLERHGHLSLTDEARERLLTLSSARADRLLRPLRHPHGLTTTNPGRLLKKQIPIRTFTEWNDVQPGILEGDLVAHCGGSCLRRPGREREAAAAPMRPNVSRRLRCLCACSAMLALWRPSRFARCPTLFTASIKYALLPPPG